MRGVFGVGIVTHFTLSGASPEAVVESVWGLVPTPLPGEAVFASGVDAVFRRLGGLRLMLVVEPA